MQSIFDFDKAEHCLFNAIVKRFGVFQKERCEKLQAESGFLLN